MKISVKLFIILGAFFGAVTLIYGFWARWTEMVGATAFFALTVFSFMIAFYLYLTDKKFADGPSDNTEGEIAQYAGEYGRFAPWSWWPLGLGIGCAVVVSGLAIDWWIFLIGVGVTIFFLIGWVFEYSKGDHAH